MFSYCREWGLDGGKFLILMRGCRGPPKIMMRVFLTLGLILMRGSRHPLGPILMRGDCDQLTNLGEEVGMQSRCKAQ